MHQVDLTSIRLSDPLLQRALVIGALLVGLSACDPSDPASAGRNAMAKGDIAAAAIHLRSAVQAQPESAELRVLLANALERQHDLAGVEQHLLRALGSGGDENVLVPRIALIMLDRNEAENLIRTFKDRRLSDPAADSSVRGAVALAYLATKQFARAEEHLKGAVDSPTVNLARAQMLALAGKAPEALDKLGLAKADAEAPWWILRAAKRIALSAGDEAKALAFIKRAHEAVPWHRGVLGEYGEAMFEAGKFDEAAAARDQLRKLAPASFSVFYLDALLHRRAGRIEESHAAALNALKAAPEHIPSILLAASAELQKGDLLMADKRLEMLLRKQPDSLPGLRLIAQSQMRQGKTREAADSVKRGLSLAPKDPSLLRMRADFELAGAQPKLAAATLTELLSVQPDDADAMLRLARIKHGSGDPGAAARLLDQAVAAGAQDTALLARAVATALDMNNPVLARKIAEQSVAAHPDDVQAMLTKGAVQSAQNDRAGAWATTLSVLDKKPDAANALSVLAAMARTPAQRQELMARQAKAIEMGAANPQIYLDHAALLRLTPSGRPQALGVLERGLQKTPGAIALREALVEDYLRAGDTEKAIGIAQTGASASGAPAGAVALLASVYERLGKSSQATETYRKLANDYPQRADWRLKLAQLEAAANRPAEAAGILRSLIAERPFDIAPYLALAAIHGKDKPGEALAVAREMGQRAEMKGAAMLLEGDILLSSGKPDEALAQFGKAAKDGVVPAALLRSVKLHDQMGRRAAADEELAAALRRFPDDPSVVGVAAQRAQEGGNPGRAVELLQKLTAKLPGDPFLRNDLAWAQLAAGRPEALDNARLAAAALPNNANALHTLGLALAKAGKQDEAIATLRTSANLAPLAALPRLHLSEHLLASGDKAGASSTLQSINAGLLGDKDRAALAKMKSQLDIR